jgi:hypothetical protein
MKYFMEVGREERCKYRIIYIYTYIYIRRRRKKKETARH